MGETSTLTRGWHYSSHKNAHQDLREHAGGPCCEQERAQERAQEHVLQDNEVSRELASRPPRGYLLREHRNIMPTVMRCFFSVEWIAHGNKISWELARRCPRGKLARGPRADVESTGEGENGTAHKNLAQEVAHKSEHKRKQIFR
jgi:hypothetical protein